MGGTTVLTNGAMSEDDDVQSDVPQGTVLAWIIFMIMISDRQIIVKCFADYIGISEMIGSENQKGIQKDIDIIYK